MQCWEPSLARAPALAPVLALDPVLALVPVLALDLAHALGFSDSSVQFVVDLVWYYHCYKSLYRRHWWYCRHNHPNRQYSNGFESLLIVV